MKEKTVRVRKCVLAMLLVVVTISTTAFAGELLCRGNHNYYHQIIEYPYNGPEGAPVEIGKLVSEDDFTKTYRIYKRYTWSTFVDKYGICVCGAGKWVERKTHTGYGDREEPTDQYITLVK